LRIVKGLRLISILIFIVTFGALYSLEKRVKVLAESQTRILLANASVFDVTTGLMSEPQDILIEGERIKSVGKISVVPRDIKRIECSGKYVIPGLWDCHTHLAFLTTLGEDQPQKGLEDFVRNGITQARDVGGPIEVMREMKESITKGEMLGPEIFYTGPMLEKAPLHWEVFNKELPGFTVAVNTKEDVERLISELIADGASMVKTFNKMDMDVFTHLVDSALKNKLKVVHDPGTPLFHMVPMDKAIDLGVMSIEHGKAPWPVVLTDDLQEQHDTLLSDNENQEEREALAERIYKAGVQSVSMGKLQKLIDKMLKKDVYFCPTLQVFAQMSELPRPEGVTEEVYAKRAERRKAVMEVGILFTKEIFRNRVRILVGQDGIFPEGTFKEMRVLKKCGLPESEIVKGATIYPAEWLGVEDRLGSVSPGKQANILILDKNPLEDINNIKSTSLVLMKGKAISKGASDPNKQKDTPSKGIMKTLARPDLVLHYKDYGKGEPVLVLMGGPGFSGEGMEPVAQMIAKKGRAIVPDQRGSGGSIPKDAEAIILDATVADFEALREELGLAKWTVWGCSWGGMLAMDYASKFPDSLKGLVLVGSGGTSWASFYKEFSDNMTARMSADDRAALKYWSQPDVVAQDPMRAEIEGIRAILPSQFHDRSKAHQAIAILKVGREHYNPDAGNYLVPDYEKRAAARIEALRKVDIPTLIIQGRQDPMPESVALENQKLLKAKLVWLDRSGHWPWIEQPVAFEKALFEFLFH
jgi:proline iminopeptidase